jgi:hypothetical protein
MPLNIIIRRKGSLKERKSREYKNETLRHYYKREQEQGSRFFSHGMSKDSIKKVLSE